MTNNEYHDFLYIWQPKEFKLFEIDVDKDKKTYIRNTFSILEDSRNGPGKPYLLVLLDQLSLFTDVWNEFEKHSEYYLFCCNYNYYLKDINLSKLFPTIKNVYIFSIEVLWKKSFPTNDSFNDFILENKKNQIIYDNLENVNVFAKNHNDLNITYLICESGIENLDRDILNSYQYKIKNFNIFTVINLLLASKLVQDPAFGTVNDKKIFNSDQKKTFENPKILNLNRRPDVHRFMITQILLGQYHSNLSSLKVSWLGDAHYDNLHIVFKDDNYYSNLIREKLIENFNEKELVDLFIGEELLKSQTFCIDEDTFKDDGFFRFVDAYNLYEDVFLEIVSESIFFGPLGDVSEKSIRPLVRKTPMVIAGGPNSFRVLENLGFVSYNDLLKIDDSNPSSLLRLRSILEFTKSLSTLSSKSLQDYSVYIHSTANKEITHNYEMFISNKLTENIIKCIQEIYQ